MSWERAPQLRERRAGYPDPSRSGSHTRDVVRPGLRRGRTGLTPGREGLPRGGGSAGESGCEGVADTDTP